MAEKLQITKIPGTTATSVATVEHPVGVHFKDSAGSVDMMPRFIQFTCNDHQQSRFVARNQDLLNELRGMFITAVDEQTGDRLISTNPNVQKLEDVKALVNGQSYEVADVTTNGSAIRQFCKAAMARLPKLP